MSQAKSFSILDEFDRFFFERRRRWWIRPTVCRTISWAPCSATAAVGSFGPSPTTCAGAFSLFSHWLCATALGECGLCPAETRPSTFPFVLMSSYLQSFPDVFFILLNYSMEPFFSGQHNGGPGVCRRPSERAPTGRADGGVGRPFGWWRGASGPSIGPAAHQSGNAETRGHWIDTVSLYAKCCFENSRRTMTLTLRISCVVIFAYHNWLLHRLKIPSIVIFIFSWYVPIFIVDKLEISTEVKDNTPTF